MDKTLLKGLQVLEHVVASSDPVRSTDVATTLGLMQSNAHRVLKTLQHAGYLVQDPQSRTFSGSLKLWELGSQIVGRLDLRRSASVQLHELAQETGEAVHLSILDQAEVIYIDKIDSPQAVGAYTRTGGRAPAHCVATGKALLSQLSEESLAPLLTNLKRFSPNTITGAKALADELRLTRERGYSVNKGEWREGVWGLASVIFDARDEPVAAVGVSGPDFRLCEPERTAEMGEAVKRYARAISLQLGNRA